MKGDCLIKILELIPLTVAIIRISPICWREDIAKLAREHNDANVLSMPGRFISKEEAKKIVEIFLDTPFEGGRHQRRIDKIPL